MDWQSCKRGKFVKEVQPDKSLIQSLQVSSHKKQNTQKLLPLNDDTTTSKISLAYDALRELLEAYSIMKGYKLYNHECYTAFLKEIIQQSAYADTFDVIRKIRNDINYYGKNITAEEGESIIKDIEELIKAIEDLIQEET